MVSFLYWQNRRFKLSHKSTLFTKFHNEDALTTLKKESTTYGLRLKNRKELLNLVSFSVRYFKITENEGDHKDSGAIQFVMTNP